MSTTSWPAAGAGPTLGALRPITGRGWRRGLNPLVRKEIGEWFGTRRWIVQLVTWLLLVNGIVALVMAVGDPGDDPLQVFVMLGVFATGIGAVVSAQSAVVGEKQRGTAAWILSKPVSRSAFLLSKVVANTLGLVLLGCLVPCAGYLLECALLGVTAPSLSRLAAAGGLWVMHLFVYVSLTIALGTAFAGRSPVVSIGTSLVLAGQFLGDMVPLPILTVLPWILPRIADRVARGDSVPVSIPLAVTAAVALAVSAAVFGLWRLHRQEL